MNLHQILPRERGRNEAISVSSSPVYGGGVRAEDGGGPFRELSSKDDNPGTNGYVSSWGQDLSGVQPTTDPA